MAQHRLRREIIATAVTNTIAHRMGPTFAFRLQEETGFGAAEVARAFTVAREIFSIRQTWYAIEALDNKVAANLQLSMLFQTSRFLRQVTRWLLGVDGEMPYNRGRGEALQIGCAQRGEDRSRVAFPSR